MPGVLDLVRGEMRQIPEQECVYPDRVLGKKFCRAAKDAFWLIFRNAMRIAICAMIAPFVKKFGVLFVMVFTTFVGYQLLNVVFDDLSSPVGPCLVFLLIGNMVGRLVMGVF